MARPEDFVSPDMHTASNAPDLNQVSSSHGPSHFGDEYRSKGSILWPGQRTLSAPMCIPLRMHRISIKPHRAMGQAILVMNITGKGNILWPGQRGPSGSSSGASLRLRLGRVLGHPSVDPHKGSSPQKKGSPGTQHNGPKPHSVPGWNTMGLGGLCCVPGQRLWRLSRAAVRKKASA